MGFLIARFCLAVVFLYSAADMLWNWRSSKGEGLPWPAAFVGATVVTQLVGGLVRSAREPTSSRDHPAL